MTKSLLIGTYTQPILHGTGDVLLGRGEGIYGVTLDEATGHLGQPSVLTRTANPSFLCLSKDGRQLYAVNELKEFDGQAQGSISAFSHDGREICVRPTGGTDPCHVALSPDGRLLVVANFMSGSVCAYDVNDDGSLAERGQLFQYTGHSSDPQRQAGPHAHSTTFRGGDVFVPDLGLDLIHIFAYEPGSGLAEKTPYRSRPGSGPRYCEFGNDHLYCINELDSTIDTLCRVDGSLCLVSTASTLPNSFTGHSICGTMRVAPDGRHVYASNRGHDSFAVFEAMTDGTLTRQDIVPSGGKTPRDFTITPDGHFLLVAHQDSDSVVSFAIGDDGTLNQCDEAEIPTPVCVIWDEPDPGASCARH
ncbi:MAG: lactonase family protein [Propionibacteriaceae bacterium]|nr:lactonase family protein [Propionibacteriaceae bacterium]